MVNFCTVELVSHLASSIFNCWSQGDRLQLVDFPLKNSFRRVGQTFISVNNFEQNFYNEMHQSGWPPIRRRLCQCLIDLKVWVCFYDARRVKTCLDLSTKDRGAVYVYDNPAARLRDRHAFKCVQVIHYPTRWRTSKKAWNKAFTISPWAHIIEVSHLHISSLVKFADFILSAELCRPWESDCGVAL